MSITTSTTPTAPGYYWYREDEWGWTVHLIFKDLEHPGHLLVREYSGDDNELAEYTGQWGPEIEEPKE